MAKHRPYYLDYLWIMCTKMQLKCFMHNSLNKDLFLFIPIQEPRYKTSFIVAGYSTYNMNHENLPLLAHLGCLWFLASMLLFLTNKNKLRVYKAWQTEGIIKVTLPITLPINFTNKQINSTNKPDVLASHTNGWHDIQGFNVRFPKRIHTSCHKRWIYKLNVLW